MMPTIGVTLFVHALVILVKSLLNLLGLRSRGKVKSLRITPVSASISVLVVFLVAGCIVYSLSFYIAAGLRDNRATWRIGQEAASRVGLDESLFFVYQLNASTKQSNN